MKTGYRKSRLEQSKEDSQQKLMQDTALRIRTMQESLHEFAMDMVREVTRELLEDEIRQLRKNSESPIYRHGKQRGAIVANGQKLRIERPRARYQDGTGEVKLTRYEQMQSPDAMSGSVMKRVVRGVSSRNYKEVIDASCDGFGIERSSVSRAFVRGSQKALEELRQRKFEGRFAAIVIDGKDYAGLQLIVALGVRETGEKTILGLREGATENAQVTTELLEELRDRGIDTTVPTLFVLDGAKALRAAVKRVFGDNALIQRCQIHKKRNVRAHVSDAIWVDVSERMSKAYAEESYQAALKSLETTHRWLKKVAPDAAVSLAEGMEETLTLARLGITGALRISLLTTNLIESTFSVCETTTARVKRWRDGSMRLRWCAAGLLKAEQNFRKIRGYKDIHVIIDALDQQGKTTQLDQQKAAA